MGKGACPPTIRCGRLRAATRRPSRRCCRSRRRARRRHRARRRDTGQYRAALRRAASSSSTPRPSASGRHTGAALAGDAKRRCDALDRLPALPRRPEAARPRRRARRRASRIRPGLEARDGSWSCGLLRHPASAAPPGRDHRLGHDDPGYWAAPHSARPRSVPLPARVGHARLRLAGRARRAGRASRAARARRARRRRRPVRARGARNRAAARIAAKLLVVDDGGYGILREYQRDASGGRHRSSSPGRDSRRSPRLRRARAQPARPRTSPSAALGAGAVRSRPSSSCGPRSSPRSQRTATCG